MASRREYGEGSIYFDNGRKKWIGALDIGKDAKGRRRYKRCSGDSRAEVRATLEELKAEHARGQLDDPTVTEMMEHYIDVALPSMGRTASTIDGYRWALSKIEPAFGDTKARALTPGHVEKLLNSQEDLSKSSLNRIRVCLQASLTEAEKRGWVDRNVARLAHTPPSHTKTRRALTLDQLAALREQIRGSRMELLVELAVRRGLRPGEIFGLKWEDFDLEAAPPTMSVNRSLTKNEQTRRYELGPVKTARSQRTLVIPESVMPLVLRQQEHVAELQQRAYNWQDMDLVFPNRLGGIMNPSNFRRDFKRLTVEAGIGEWAPYELRHSAATLLSEAGVPLEELVDLFGHVDERMIMRTYRHVNKAVDAGADLDF